MEAIITIACMFVMAVIAVGAIVWRSGQTGGRLAQKVKHCCDQIGTLFKKSNETGKRMDDMEDHRREDMQRIFDKLDGLGGKVQQVKDDVTAAVQKSHGRLRQSLTHQQQQLTVIMANCNHCTPDMISEMMRGPGLLNPGPEPEEDDESGTEVPDIG